MFISKFVFLFITLSCISYSVQQEKVKVTLYYEGLCPYCHEFIEEQLYPGYQQIGNSVTLDLVPFGHAYSNKTDNGIEWTCQHGPLECYLNEVHACLIDLKPTQDQLMSYVYCTTVSSSRDNTTSEIEDLAKQCAEDNNIKWSELNNCLQNGKSDELLLAYEKRQNDLDIRIQYVPNIRFNDVYDEDLESKARMDFVWTICHIIQGDKPDVCN